MYVKPGCLSLYIKIKKLISQRNLNPYRLPQITMTQIQKNKDIILIVTIKSSKSKSEFRAHVTDKESLQNLYNIILNA